MIQYTYQNQIEIHQNIENVVDAFLDYKHYHRWQPTLKDVVLNKGELLEVGHEIILVFEQSEGSMMQMYETILHLNLPNQIDIQYVMGTTKNIQRNTFTSDYDKVIWTCNTTFFFEQNPGADEIVFKQATKQGLIAFKNYVESL